MDPQKTNLLPVLRDDSETAENIFLFGSVLHKTTG